MSQDPTGSITSATTRGFTGQEEMDNVGIVNLNGRVYNPRLARFTSADPVTENPFSTRGWNRYAYVGNNPLGYTDPSGYCFLGCFWKSKIFKQVVVVVVAVVVTVVAAEILPAVIPVLTEGSAGLAVVSGAIGGAVSGGVSGGGLKGILIGAATGAAFAEVGNLTTGPGALFGNSAENFAANVAGHAAVGCVRSVVMGGQCGSGALAAAVGAATGMLTADMGDVAGVVASSVGGGLGSIAGGGKFFNGAATGAFGYLFNQAAHNGLDPNIRHQMGVDASVADYESRGYNIVSSSPLAVSVPGFDTPRVYDFLVQDPDSGKNIGVEVKTTLYDTIRLNPAQVARDVSVMVNGGIASKLDVPVNGVGYATYCWACGLVPNVNSQALRSALEAAQVPFTHGGYPGQSLP